MADLYSLHLSIFNISSSGLSCSCEDGVGPGMSRRAGVAAVKSGSERVEREKVVPRTLQGLYLLLQARHLVPVINAVKPAEYDVKGFVLAIC